MQATTPFDALADLRQKVDDDIAIKQAELTASGNEEASLMARLTAIQARKKAEQDQLVSLNSYKTVLAQTAQPPLAANDRQPEGLADGIVLMIDGTFRNASGQTTDSQGNLL